MKNLAFVKETLSKGGYIAAHGQTGKAGGKFLAGGLTGWSLMNIEGRLLLDNVLSEYRALHEEGVLTGLEWSHGANSGTEWRYENWHQIEQQGETHIHINILNKGRFSC